MQRCRHQCKCCIGCRSQLANVKRVAVLPPSNGSTGHTFALPVAGLQGGEGHSENLLNGIVTAMGEENHAVVETLAIERALDDQGAKRVDAKLVVDIAIPT